MKRLITRKNAFTLVELLIVIALIAILSVAVLATINPIEQSNKAKDSSIQNDAAEVMNAYERYYTVKASYPWMDVDGQATLNSADLPWFGNSTLSGFALCSSTDAAAVAATPCLLSTDAGLLIKTDELKDSFLSKGYTALVAGDPGYNAAGLNYLWVDKKDAATGHNSIYVCYIPKAKSNRTATTVLYTPVLDGGGAMVGLTRAAADQFVNGYPIAAWTFATTLTSMYKCVP